MNALSNKAIVVLALLRENGEMSCKDIAETIHQRTPCGDCNGTGEGDDSRYGCRRCYGRGRAFFTYSDAYVALTQLRKRRLVSRRHLRDEWGDELPGLMWAATTESSTHADPLEALFLAPSAPEPSR